MAGADACKRKCARAIAQWHVAHVCLQNAGASQLTFHYEALKDDAEVSELIDAIKAAGLRVGVAIKPRTSIEKLIAHAQKLDNALVMTVEPGFGGQKFM